ncbi:MAG: AAA family ATPase, partial [Erysipelotrichaceae bacterium]|nr:AAA family ATPase [Erysipelotrichaceae bacterium]
MLARFEVENFKCFQDKMILDLSQVAKYNFNSNLTVNGLVKNAVIFGKNGSGKTNIGKAIMDIVNHLTDGKRKTIGRNIPFINLDSNKRYASFLYEFHFEEGIIIYSYEKDDRQLLVSEKVIIDGQVVLDYDHTRKTGKVLIKGTENLNIDSMPDGLSLVKYAYTNSGNNTDKTRVLLDKMIDFVNRMLMFYSLGNTEYFGATDGLEDF